MNESAAMAAERQTQESMGGKTIETEFVDESERGFKYDPASVYYKDRYMVV